MLKGKKAKHYFLHLRFACSSESVAVRHQADGYALRLAELGRHGLRRRLSWVLSASGRSCLHQARSVYISPDHTVLSLCTVLASSRALCEFTINSTKGHAILISDSGIATTKMVTTNSLLITVQRVAQRQTGLIVLKILGRGHSQLRSEIGRVVIHQKS